MSDISDIREGIKTVLTTANPKLRVFPYPPSSLTDFPALVVDQDSPIEYHRTNLGGAGNSVQLEISCTLALSGSIPEEMWAEIDKYRSPSGTESIWAGIETDDTLDSSVDVATLVSSSQVQRNQNERGIWLFSCTFTITAIKSLQG